MAKATAGEAFRRAASDNLQIHGGVGFTWEYDPHLYLKRSKWARPAFGDADFHYDRAIAIGEK
jgi:alkylation response protein AidB-like acyl-CoA dehydrogenase